MTLAGASLAGCSSDAVFRDDFTTETLGTRPSDNPPGDPVGDTIYSSDGLSPVAGQLTVVDDPDLGSRAVRYANVATPVWYRYLGFMGAPVALSDSERYWALWYGVAEFDFGGSDLRVWLGDGHFGAVAALVFKANGTLQLQTGTGSGASSGSLPTYETLGTVTEGQPHTVIWSVNRTTEEYAVALFQPSGHLASGHLASGLRPVLDTGPLDTERPTLYRWYEDNANGSGDYVIDGIRILFEEPKMAP